MTPRLFTNPHMRISMTSLVFTSMALSLNPWGLKTRSGQTRSSPLGESLDACYSLVKEREWQWTLISHVLRTGFSIWRLISFRNSSFYWWLSLRSCYRSLKGSLSSGIYRSSGISCFYAALSPYPCGSTSTSPRLYSPTKYLMTRISQGQSRGTVISLRNLVELIICSRIRLGRLPRMKC